jgi:type II secretory pathway pseudopilin PulG
MQHHSIPARRSEQGFTLIEALIAIVILITGIAAIANLLLVAGTSNTVANHTTAAAQVATQQMEALKAMRYDLLATGGNVDADNGITGECGVTAVNTTFNCTTKGTGRGGDFVGVGSMHVRWLVGPPLTVGSTSTRFITVAAESRSAALARRSRVVLTTFRTDNP